MRECRAWACVLQWDTDVGRRAGELGVDVLTPGLWRGPRDWQQCGGGKGVDNCEVLGRAPEQCGPSGNDLKVLGEGGHQEDLTTTVLV